MHFFQKKDIKDRLFMSETEGIVLSPQRRSFITGCQVSKDPPKEPESLSGNSSNAGTGSKSSSQDRGDHRGGDRCGDRGGSDGSSLRPDSMSNSGSRRVGSGRIRPSASASEDYDVSGSSRGEGPRGGRGSNYGDRGDTASESRYGFNRDRDRGERVSDRDRGWYDRDYDKGGRGGRNMTSSRPGQPPDSRKDRGHRGSRRNEEPEWMSAPINQDDMMELKGFDDSPEKETQGKP